MISRLAVALLSAVILLTPASPAQAAPAWAPDGLIRPGVQISSDSGQCTSNFVFYEPLSNGSYDVFIGLAAHCFSLGGPTQTNGCSAPSRGLGSRASVQRASFQATLVYSSWVTMQQVNETNANTCAVNDFALVKLDPRDHANVNPTLQFFGGPDGTRTTTTAFGENVYSYGNSGLRFGVSRLSPKRGISTGTGAGGWSHSVYTVSPGIPGDSGSAVVDANGDALGVVVTIRSDGSNGVSDINKMLGYLRAKTSKNVQLAVGLEAFTPRLV